MILDVLLSAAPSGVWDSLIGSLVEFVSAGFLIAVFAWFFGILWEMVVGFFRMMI